MMKSRNEFPTFFEYFNKLGQGVEVGTHYGEYAKLLSGGYTGKIYCVDVWYDTEAHKHAKETLNGLCELCQGTSEEWSKKFPDGHFDWIFIDADHTYPSVKQDLDCWWPKLRRGGVFAGHDYVKLWDFGVIEAVDQFAAKHDYVLNLTTDDRWQDIPLPSWYFIKK